MVLQAHLFRDASVGLKSQALNQGIAVFTAVPCRGVTCSCAGLVAAEVEILRIREHPGQLPDYVVEHGCGLARSGLCHAKQVPVDARLGPHPEIPETAVRGAGKLVVRIEYRGRMPRKVNFGHHYNAALMGVGHYFSYLLPGVEAVVAVPARIQYGILATVGAQPCQGVVAFYLNPPPLVVREMPMEAVELVDGHDIQVLLDFIHREEMAGHIQVQAAPDEPGGIFDGQAGHGPVGRDSGGTIHGGGHQLPERLPGVKNARAA